MKQVYLLSILLVLLSCSSYERKLPGNVEIIPVVYEEPTKDASAFLEKIEIVPLETNDSSLVFNPGRAIYNKEMDMYALYVKGEIVYTFSGDGTYIGNSKKVKGQGPKEYFMAVDVQFNPYLKGVDILNPYGTIYTYSPSFKFISKREYQQEFPVNNFVPLDSVNYLFTYPFIWTDQEVSFENIETHQKTNATYQGTISSGNYLTNVGCFHEDVESITFAPFGLNYYLYQVDNKNKKLLPVIYMDFGEAEVKAQALPGYATGKRTTDDTELQSLSKGLLDRKRFLNESREILPLIKFFNEGYVYIFMVKEIMPGRTYLYNRKTKKGFLLKDGVPFDIYFCFDIVDNVLLSVCPPYELSHFIDRRFMSAKEIRKMEQLKEDDNPVIIKYYLK